jgi:anti-sigma regulatory factor (Ser/Thr protein kinase)
LPRVRFFAAHPSSLSEAREFVRKLGSDSRVPEGITEELALAVTEACSNAVDHADTMLVIVSWRIEDRGVEIQVKDDGIFRQNISFPEFTEKGPGFGIPLMMAMVDEFGISRGTADSPGTVVRLRKNVDELTTDGIVRIPETAPSPGS